MVFTDVNIAVNREGQLVTRQDPEILIAKKLDKIQGTTSWQYLALSIFIIFTRRFFLSFVCRYYVVICPTSTDR